MLRHEKGPYRPTFGQASPATWQFFQKAIFSGYHGGSAAGLSGSVSCRAAVSPTAPPCHSLWHLRFRRTEAIPACCPEVGLGAR